MKLLFVCIENSKRSQMAEAFARAYGSNRLEVHSAGSSPEGVVDPMAVNAMREKGHDLTSHRSKSLEDVPDGPYDVVVSMGCGDDCPWIPAERREDWDLPDPKGGDEVREVRDLIEWKVLDLLELLDEKG